MHPVKVVKAFMERISAQDVDGLCELMTEDHTFFDACDHTATGREEMRKGWKGYYAMVPDYWVTCEFICSDNDIVLAVGRAGGTYTSNGTLRPENKWDIPAAWKAVVRDGKVAEWRVYADNEPIREIAAREKAE
jgi:ketosteroid isomerase-like protein